MQKGVGGKLTLELPLKLLSAQQTETEFKKQSFKNWSYQKNGNKKSCSASLIL